MISVLLKVRESRRFRAAFGRSIVKRDVPLQGLATKHIIVLAAFWLTLGPARPCLWLLL